MISKYIRGSFNYRNLLFLLILILAFYMRIYNLEKRVGFGADQEDLFYKANELLSGDPVLLGMPTSVGGFSIGPIFTYFWSIFSFLFSGNPVAGNYLSIFLGLVTIVAVFFTGLEIFKSYLTAFFLVILYSFSYSIYVWDISPWPPSLFYLSQVLIIGGAYIALKKPLGFILLSLGFLLGFSSHISMFISFVPIFVFWLIKRREIVRCLTKKYILISGLIIFIGFLPNLLFDITHKFVNTKRLFGLLENPVTESFYPVTFSKVFKSLYESGVKIIIPVAENNTYLLIFSTIIFLSILALLRSKNRDFILFILLSLFAVPFIFLFWKGNFSEYYLTMITVPYFIFLIGSIFDTYLNNKKLLLIIFLGVFLYLNISEWRIRGRPLNLAAMKNAVILIIEKGGYKNYGVSLSTQPGYQFGYKYLFDYYGASPDIPPKKGETKIFTIVIPPGMDGIQAKVEFDGIGVLWEGID